MDSLDARLGRREVQDGELANAAHHCMNCRFCSAERICVKYGNECSHHYACVSWDMTYAAETALSQKKAEKFSKR